MLPWAVNRSLLFHTLSSLLPVTSFFVSCLLIAFLSRSISTIHSSTLYLKMLSMYLRVKNPSLISILSIPSSSVVFMSITPASRSLSRVSRWNSLRFSSIIAKDPMKSLHLFKSWLEILSDRIGQPLAASMQSMNFLFVSGFQEYSRPSEAG